MDFGLDPAVHRWESNLRPVDHKSDSLTTTLPSHPEAEMCYNWCFSLCVSVLRHYSGELLDLLLCIDKLLSTDEHFLLGVWLDSAKNLSTSEQERRLYEYNARNQITLWGPNGEVCIVTFISFLCVTYVLLSHDDVPVYGAESWRIISYFH